MNTKVSSVERIPELHLMIIWEKGRVIEKEIISEIYNEYKVLGEYEISWDEECFSENLTRFYGQNLPKNSRKEQHCGVNSFLLITFIDDNPVYQCVESSRGSEYVNRNVFDLKEKFRKLTGGGHKIHATNNPKETAHDLALLLGVNYTDYIQKYKQQESVKREFIRSFAGGGRQGWDSLEQLFLFMNNYLNYVVLRNFEILPDNYYAEDHGDIDFLVEDLDEAIYFMGAKKVHRKNYRAYYQICINGDNIFIDLRSIGDQYYDKYWAVQILNNRRKLSAGFYIPCASDYFYSLVYHALVHKKKIADDYHEKIALALVDIEPDVEHKELTFDVFFVKLRGFLEKNKYRMVRPKDKSVFFDTQYQYPNNIIDEFSSLNIQDVKPFLTESWKSGSGTRYFQGQDASGVDVFIKLVENGDIVKREYDVSKMLFSMDHITIPRVIYYRKNKGINFIVFEKLAQFRTLDQIGEAKLTDEFLEKVFQGILEMILVLNKLDLVHRDIRPANIIINDNDEPVLIDFQYVIDSQRKKLKELKFVRKKPTEVKELGEDYARGLYRWDDAFSALIVYDEYVTNPTKKLLKIQASLKALVGQKEIIGIKSTNFHKICWYVNNTLLKIKLKTKVVFYKFCQGLFKKNYTKKITKNYDRLSKLHRVIQ